MRSARRKEKDPTQAELAARRAKKHIREIEATATHQLPPRGDTKELREAIGRLAFQRVINSRRIPPQIERRAEQAAVTFLNKLPSTITYEKFMDTGLVLSTLLNGSDQCPPQSSDKLEVRERSNFQDAWAKRARQALEVELTGAFTRLIDSTSENKWQAAIDAEVHFSSLNRVLRHHNTTERGVTIDMDPIPPRSIKNLTDALISASRLHHKKPKRDAILSAAIRFFDESTKEMSETGSNPAISLQTIAQMLNTKFDLNLR
jgi:hypothetical protein